MKVIWEQCKDGCDGEVQRLIIDGDCVAEGDYYHDKIKYVIQGFIDGLKFAGKKFKVEEVYKCDYGCGDDDE